MCHDNEEWYTNWRGLTCRFKIDMKSFTNFGPSAQTSKKFVFELALCDQSIYFLSYKSTEGLSFIALKRYANFEKNWLVVWKKTREIWQTFPRALKSGEIGTLMNPFVQSRKGMVLKFTEVLCVMTTKNNAKFEEELTCHFKTDMKNLTNFDLSTGKSLKNFPLIGSFDQSM